MSLNILAFVGIVAMSSPPLSEVENYTNLEDALLGGTLNGDVKVRYEDVEESLLRQGTRGAQAPTARFRLSYESAQFHYLSTGLEYRSIFALDGDRNYFDGSNNEFDDAAVLDPGQSFLSRYWVAYSLANTKLTYGRQSIELDNERFWGVQDHRQGGSSHSGLTLLNESLNFLRLRVGKLYRYESPLNDTTQNGQASIDGRYGHIEYRGIIHSALSLYFYDLEGADGQSFSDSSMYDSTTWGVRFAGDIKSEPRLEYTFEYARQSSKSSNPNDYSERYGHVALALTHNYIRLGAGIEVLGGGENGFFVAPMGDLHRFQGWADQFNNDGLGNIAGGIEDRYTSISYLFGDWGLVEATYHDFESESNAPGFGRLGCEIDLKASYESQDLSLSLRYADFHARRFGSDTTKTWVDLEWRF